MEDFLTESLRMEIEASELKTKQSGSFQGKRSSGSSKCITSASAGKRTFSSGFSRRKTDRNTVRGKRRPDSDISEKTDRYGSASGEKRQQVFLCRQQ